eukprot:TRINITY_DN2691_c0_g2_i1.p1 TRINITY_DN2691_c0_g2~~TRINITY_DN2691_c0_g2_i1.p1  ORF type:complete len:186 (-),score=53.71 TRINITY_DN2691_c0_g2_i1:336-845(-)
MHAMPGVEDKQQKQRVMSGASDDVAKISQVARDDLSEIANRGLDTIEQGLEAQDRKMEVGEVSRFEEDDHRAKEEEASANLLEEEEDLHEDGEPLHVSSAISVGVNFSEVEQDRDVQLPNEQTVHEGMTAGTGSDLEWGNGVNDDADFEIDGEGGEYYGADDYDDDVEE